MLWWSQGDIAQPADMALPCCERHWPHPSLLWDAGVDRQEQGLLVRLGVRVAPFQEAEQGQNSWVLGYVQEQMAQQRDWLPSSFP